MEGSRKEKRSLHARLQEVGNIIPDGNKLARRIEQYRGRTRLGRVIMVRVQWGNRNGYRRDDAEVYPNDRKPRVQGRRNLHGCQYGNHTEFTTKHSEARPNE